MDTLPATNLVSLHSSRRGCIMPVSARISRFEPRSEPAGAVETPSDAARLPLTVLLICGVVRVPASHLTNRYGALSAPNAPSSSSPVTP